MVKELRCPVKFRYKFNWLEFFKKKLLFTDQLFKEKKKLGYLKN